MASNWFDVLIIGGGAAGLYAALCLPSHFRVGLVTKETLSLSASDWAQGGIAAAIAPDDSPTLHLADTLRAGAGLCEPGAVSLLVERAAGCIQSLLQMGVAFDRQGDQLAMTLEAAHSRRRVLHAADTTGRAIVNQLTATVLSRKNIQVLSQALVLDLWMQAGRCAGVQLLYQNQMRLLAAGAIVLATGGGGQVFAQTTNPAVSTGDGVAMAWRSGAQLRDLEFVQFHPTALTLPNAPRFLISEAVRGEGAHLVDADGDRFAFAYHPDGELAPRDVVSRAIFTHLQKLGDPTAPVWLDLRPIDPDRIRYRFPNIIQVCQHWGVDLFQTPIPVAPAAHYWMGGITTNLLSQTTLPGLYAVGETASTGVHGANRLASNSLLECLVFGAQLAELECSPIAPLVMPSSSKVLALEFTAREIESIAQWRQAIPRLVWKSAGITREAQTLAVAIAQIQAWQSEFAALPCSQVLCSLLANAEVGSVPAAAVPHLQQWTETRNLLDVGYLMLQSAQFRQESRGGHYRTDYPEAQLDWQVHSLVQQQTWWRSAPVVSA